VILSFVGLTEMSIFQQENPIKLYPVKDLGDQEKMEKEVYIRRLYDSAHQHFARQEYDSSFSILNDLIRDHPLASPDFYTLRGAIYQVRNDLQNALKDLQKATEIPNGDKVNYHYNVIKVLNQIGTQESFNQAENLTRRILSKNPLWDEGYFTLIGRLLTDVTLEKYISARNLFKQFLGILPQIQNEIIRTPERLERARGWFFVIGRMNIHFWFQENANFILHGLCLDLTPEQQVEEGLRKSVDSPLFWDSPNANFVENMIKRALLLKHPELPIFALLQIDCFPRNKDDILKNRTYNDRNLEIMSRVYSKMNIHFDKYEHLISAVPQALTYYYAYHDKSNAVMFRNINQFLRNICLDLNYVAPWLTPEGKPKDNKDIWRPGCGRKLKIAFISKYLSTAHSVLRDRSGIILNMYHRYKEDTEVMYYIFDKPDSLGSNFAGQIKEHIILPKDVRQQREILGNAKHDILVFCEIGMDVFTYYLSFGRYAPLQVDTWGHSDTSGQTSIDRYYSSKWYDTDDSFQDHYSEKLVRMNSLCTFYHDPLEWVSNGFRWKTREEYGFSKMNHIYYCSQSIFKLSPDFDRVLGEILFRDPYAIILIIDAYGLKDELIRTRWEDKFGLNMSRVHFMNKMPFADFLNVIKISDILLDSYPFGGCNSSLEAFRLGKIVVTLPGKMLNGRFTLGFYQKMGIIEPICEDIDDLIRKAVFFGTNQLERERVQNLIQEKYKCLFYEQDSIVEWREQLERDYLERTC